MKNIKEILSLDIDNLREKQHQALKIHVTDILYEIIELIKTEKYEIIKDYTFYSPAGDDMGCDNTCIDFAWSGNKDDTDDIGDTISKLISLKSIKK
jgi:hypothetical protein